MTESLQTMQRKGNRSNLPSRPSVCTLQLAKAGYARIDLLLLNIFRAEVWQTITGLPGNRPSTLPA